MTVTLAQLPATMRGDVRVAVLHASREGVNAGALAVTQDARARVRTVLGPEQRMSRLTVRLRPDQGGRRVRISAATAAAGGTRINPYYRDAKSTSRPVALVGARGPAHLIEHDRRGGYDVRAGRTTGLEPRFAAAAAEAQGQAFGRSDAEVAATTARLQRPGAIPTPNGYFAHVRPGPIRRPQGGPISAAFRVAVATIDRHAAQVMDQSITKQLRRAGVKVAA